MSDTVFCVFDSREILKCQCNKCKDKPCGDFLLAIIGEVDNVEKLEVLNRKVLNALGGNKAIIISNKMIDSAGYALSTQNNFEFLYSYSDGREFGNIPEMICRYKKSAVVFTDEETSNRFIEELKKEMARLNIKKKIPLRLFNL